MRTRLNLSAAAGILTLAAGSALAQGELLSFERAREQYVSGQPRAAAQTIAMASVELRNQLGRCKDAVIGPLMMDAEPAIDLLAKRVGNGQVTSVAALDASFATFDRLLARHHQQLAAETWKRDGRAAIEMVAHDLSLATEYFARATKWEHRTLSADDARVLEDARGVAKRLRESPLPAPNEIRPVMDALGRLVNAKGSTE